LLPSPPHKKLNIGITSLLKGYRQMKPNGEPFGNAKAYEVYMGRWSRLIGRQFVSWLAITPGQLWLDVGAGTGILTDLILQNAAPSKVVGIDTSADYIAFARERLQDARVELAVGDAGSLAYESQFDVTVAGLVLNFVPSAQQTINTMRQAARNGGIVGAYVWDYGGQMEMMRHFWDAAAAVDPASRKMDAGQRFVIAKPDALRSAFDSAGLHAVDVTALDAQTRFEDFDDYWLPFLGAQGSVSNYLRGMSDSTRSALRDQLARQLPTAPDGSITLIARAWAVKGTK